MTCRALVLAAGALALVAGCNKGSSGPAFRLKEPSAIAIFWAYSSKHVELQPLAAVANTGQDELVLFSPIDDTVLPAPIVIRPLSIPIPFPRPALVASARFTKPEPAAQDAPPVPDRPDLLAVVGAGSTQLQLIRTWKSNVAPDPGLDTVAGQACAPPACVDLGGEVVALIATPTVDTSGVVPDRVRVIAALAGGRLAIVEYQWTGDPGIEESNGENRVTLANPLQPVVAVPVGFDAVSLAVDASVIGSSGATPKASPPLRNPRFLYAATMDPIPPSNVLGVAELDMSAGAPDAWPIRALNAHTPTRLVAAYTLWERVTGVEGAYNQLETPPVGASFQAFQGVAATEAVPDPETNLVHRVYAYRDPASCGPATSELCGIAVLDPATADVLEDPWHPGLTPKQYLPPLAAPAIPVALLPGSPAWNPPTGATGSLGDEVDTLHRLLVISTGGGARTTTGVLFIPSEDGRSYLADLARWEIPSNTFEISPVGSMASVTGFQQSAIDRPLIAFYEPRDIFDADATNGAEPRVLLESTLAATAYFKLTPGFTPDDIWTITYQGYLPAFEGNRSATIETDAGLPAGQLRLAFQARNADGTFSQVVNVFDPALGVRVGDIVEIWTVGTGPNARPECPDTTKSTNGVLNAPVEGRIVEVTRPDDGHRGGSLVIQPGDCVPVLEVKATACDSSTHGPWSDLPGCWASLPVASSSVQQVRIRAGSGGDPSDPSLVGKDFVVSGIVTGYAGRATSRQLTGPTDLRDPANPDGAFRFANDDEALSCPLIPYPSNANPSAIPDCDETCRASCERAVVARRARRHHLTSVYCFKGNTIIDSQSRRNLCEAYFPEFALRQETPPGASEPLPPIGEFDGTPPAGPALAFTLGVQPTTTIPDLLVVRDTQVIFDTVSGRKPVSRFGGGASSGPATSPMGATYFDRSYDTAWNKQRDRIRFFVPHVGNLILDTTPSHSNSDTHVLR